MPATRNDLDHSHSTTSEPFLLINENRLAYEALQRLKQSFTETAGLLVYIHGPSGIGKSHLVRQFLREVRPRLAQNRLAHLTASSFAAELAEASDRKTVDLFQEKYRRLDLLVCEDIQALQNRGESQRQLSATIDTLLAAGQAILLTARSLPGELAGLPPQLVNRCHGGVCVAMEFPGRSSRVKLLNHFARTRQIAVPPKVVELLAEQLPVSPRELLAALFQLETTARLDGSAVDIDFARRYLDGEVKPQSVTVSQIARTTARHFALSVADLRANRRSRNLVLPRQCAMYLARELTTESLHAIGEYFGGRNHATVLHACRRLQEVLPEEPILRHHLMQIRHGMAQQAGRKAHKT